MGKARDWMNNNSAVVTVAAVMLLLVSLAVIVWTMKKPTMSGRIVDVYYYDLGNGQLFAAKATELPPIDAASGPGNGVRAYVYGCGDCSEANRFIAYLEKFTPEAKAMQEKMMNPDPNADPNMAPELRDMEDGGTLVRAVEGGQWVTMYSEAGMKVSSELEGKCPAGVRLIPCLPGR